MQLAEAFVQVALRRDDASWSRVQSDLRAATEGAKPTVSVGATADRGAVSEATNEITGVAEAAEADIEIGATADRAAASSATSEISGTADAADAAVSIGAVANRDSASQAVGEIAGAAAAGDAAVPVGGVADRTSAGDAIGEIMGAAEAATAEVPVKADVDETSLKQAENEMKGAAGRMAGAFRDLFIAAAFTREIGKAITAASDLEQAIGGTQATFAEASGIIDDFAATSAKGFGISKEAARVLTSQIGGLLKGFGYTKAEAASTSVQLAKLGADLAATFGGRPEEAIQAIGAALRGEFNPLERFGVALNVAQINAHAMTLGLGEAAKAGDLQARSASALDLILQRTADASGQFARESGTAAGQSAILSASFEDMRARLGTQLLPIFSKVVGSLSTLVDVFGGLPGPIQTAILALVGMSVVVGPVRRIIGMMGDMTKLIKDLPSHARGAATALGVLAVATTAMALQAQHNARMNKQLAESIEDIARASDETVVAEFAEGLVAGAFAGKDWTETLDEMGRTMPGVLQRMVDLEDSSGGVTNGLVDAGLSTEEATRVVSLLEPALARATAAQKQAAATAEEGAVAEGELATKTGEAEGAIRSQTDAQLAANAAAALAAGSAEGLVFTTEEYAAAATLAAGAAGDTTVVTERYAAAAKLASSAVEGITEPTRTAAEEIEHYTAAAILASGVSSSYSGSIKNSVTPIWEMQAAAREAHQAIVDLRTAMLAGISDTFSYDSAVLALQDSVATYTERLIAVGTAQAEHGEGSAEAAAALNDLKQSEIGAAEGALEQARAFADSQGAHEGTRRQARLMRDELGRIVEVTPFLAEEIGKYDEQLAKIQRKGKVRTGVGVDGKDQAVGDAGAVEGAVDKIPRRRRTGVGLDGKDQGIGDAKDLRTEIETIPRNRRSRVDVDTAQGIGDAKDLRTEIETMPDGSATVTVDTTAGIGDAKDLRTQVESIPDGSASVTLDTSSALGAAQAFESRVDGLPDGASTVNLNTDNANLAAGAFESRMHALPEGESEINLDTDNANLAAGAFESRMHTLPDGESTINLQDDVAREGITLFEERLKAIPNEEVVVTTRYVTVGSPPPPGGAGVPSDGARVEEFAAGPPMRAASPLAAIARRAPRGRGEFRDAPEATRRGLARAGQTEEQAEEHFDLARSLNAEAKTHEQNETALRKEEKALKASAKALRDKASDTKDATAKERLQEQAEDKERQASAKGTEADKEAAKAKRLRTRASNQAAKGENLMQKATEQAEAAVQTFIDTLREQAIAQREVADALAEQSDSIQQSIDATYALDDAQDAMAEAAAKVARAFATEGVSAEQREEAVEAAAKAALDLAEAEVTAARERAEAQGKTLSEEREAEIRRAAILKQAGAAGTPAALKAELKRLAELLKPQAGLERREAAAEARADAADRRADRLDEQLVTARKERQGDHFEITVRVGDRELNDIIDTRIRKRNKATAKKASAGRRA